MNHHVSLPFSSTFMYFAESELKDISGSAVPFGPRPLPRVSPTPSTPITTLPATPPTPTPIGRKHKVNALDTEFETEKEHVPAPKKAKSTQAPLTHVEHAAQDVSARPSTAGTSQAAPNAAGTATEPLTPKKTRLDPDPTTLAFTTVPDTDYDGSQLQKDICQLLGLIGRVYDPFAPRLNKADVDKADLDASDSDSDSPDSEDNLDDEDLELVVIDGISVSDDALNILCCKTSKIYQADDWIATTLAPAVDFRAMLELD